MWRRAGPRAGRGFIKDPRKAAVAVVILVSAVAAAALVVIIMMSSRTSARARDANMERRIAELERELKEVRRTLADKIQPTNRSWLLRPFSDFGPQTFELDPPAQRLGLGFQVEPAFGSYRGTVLSVDLKWGETTTIQFPIPGRLYPCDLILTLSLDGTALTVNGKDCNRVAYFRQARISLEIVPQLFTKVP
jgi:hypothetical protein